MKLMRIELVNCGTALKLFTLAFVLATTSTSVKVTRLHHLKVKMSAASGLGEAAITYCALFRDDFNFAIANDIPIFMS
jgi:hypothetical protein